MFESIKTGLSAALDWFQNAVGVTNTALYTYILIILLVLAGRNSICRSDWDNSG